MNLPEKTVLNMNYRGGYKTLFFVFVVVSMSMLSSTTALVSYILLASYALRGGNSAVLRALALTWLIGALNPAFSAGTEVASLGKVIVFLTAALSVFSRMLIADKLTIPRGVIFTIVLGMTIIVHSIFFSHIPDVSILKAVVWTTVISTTLLAFSKLSNAEMTKISTWVFQGCVAIMIISWPLVFMPEGYLRNGRGFQGVLNHPQTYSVFTAFLCTWTAARILTIPRPSIGLMAVLASAITTLLLTQGRTGGLAFVLSVPLALSFIFVLTQRRLKLTGLRSKKLILTILASLCLCLLTAHQWLPAINNYLYKRAQYDVTDLTNLYAASRGRQTIKAMENFKENPLTGIGFGIEANREMEITRDPVFGLPLSAPTEKGNMFAAILEEVGLIVSALILIWLHSQILRASRGGLVPLSLLTCSLLINFGEAVFFSPGGNGLLAILFFGWAVNQTSFDEGAHA